MRPVGLPWRPLKFRFDDEAQTCRPSSRSGFMARHIEHPAPRHSNPASRNTWSRPSASAAARTATEPGTTSAFTWRATRCPFAMRAASRRSDRRELVQDPTKATSIFVPRMGSPPLSPMNSRASATPPFSPAAGMRSLTPTDWPGLMPQVTRGSIPAPSISTTSS